MLYAVVVVCEVLFWVVLVAGLVARYVLQRSRLGGALLVSAPLVDLVLLVAGVLDLRSGAEATPAHALAAVYLGVSVGFGHAMVSWADARFAHRFAGGPPPAPRPRHGRVHAASQRRAWGRHAVAFAVGATLLVTAVLVIDDPGRTEVLAATLRLWAVVLVVDAVVSLSYTVRPRRPSTSGVGPAR